MAREFIVSVRFTSGWTCQRRNVRVLEKFLTMTTNAFSRRTHVIGVRIAVIPLTVEIVGHVDDVIDGSSDSIDWECFEVPVRRWCCDRHRLVLAQGLLQHDEELEVVEAISSLAYGLTTNHNIGGSGVFPINIDPVNAFALHEFGEICSKGVRGC